MEISVHQALRELKLLDSRIFSALNKVFCSCIKGNQTEINGKKLKDHEEKIKADYQSVRDLIDRRSSIKSAVIMSNAVTEVVIGSEKMTVAEAIDRKTSMRYIIELLSKLKRDYTSNKETIEIRNTELDERLNNYLKSALGDTSKGDLKTIEALTKTFIENNTYKLVDPLDIVKEIEKIEKEIEEFSSNVDVVLSESNALTIIEI